MQSHDTEAAPVPFFTDARTVVEKLACDKRQWEPHKPGTGSPKTIFGLVLERGTFISNYNNEEKPTARILTADNIEWSVVGFHGYLKSEIERKDPRVGDFVAIAYKGTKPAKKEGENDANDYQLEVERNPDPTAAAALTSPSEIEEQVAADAALIDGDPGPVHDPNDPGVDEPEAETPDDIAF